MVELEILKLMKNSIKSFHTMSQMMLIIIIALLAMSFENTKTKKYMGPHENDELGKYEIACLLTVTNKIFYYLCLKHIYSLLFFYFEDYGCKCNEENCIPNCLDLKVLFSCYLVP